jgi:hypothetical protein|nr:MAG TPA: hypothetical protein [Caudoviricetes sp.]
MEKVAELLKIINKGTTCTASHKDEIRVMRAMMNDTTYKVDLYGVSGKESTYNPSTKIREMCASVMSSAAKIPMAEAQSLMREHEFKKSEAEALIEFSKEFINTYIHTGRKLPLGGREKSNVSVALKEIPAGERTFPQVVEVKKDGTKIYSSGRTYVKAYESVKVFAPAPSWLK